MILNRSDYVTLVILKDISTKFMPFPKLSKIVGRFIILYSYCYRLVFAISLMMCCTLIQLTFYLLSRGQGSINIIIIITLAL